jgi:DNA repair ATPase RecN
METAIQIALVAFAVVLFCVATFLFAREKSVPASAAMGFVFLFIVVLSLSKFKHVNGFGFEAETWDQKQVEAASLVEKLKTLTEATSQQVALLASKLGFWDSALTNPQLGELLKQTRQILNGTDIPPNRRDQILEPIVKRSTQNYDSAAYQLVTRAFQQREQSLQIQRSAEISAGKSEAANIFSKEIQEVNGELTRLRKDLPNDTADHVATVQALLAFTKGTSLAKDQELLQQLSEIDADTRFFDDNKTLRREIDWTFVYR